MQILKSIGGLTQLMAATAVTFGTPPFEELIRIVHPGLHKYWGLEKIEFWSWSKK